MDTHPLLWITALSLLLPTPTGSACGGSHVVKRQPIRFSSPGYGRTPYPDNAMCYWSFRSDNEKPLKLTFLDLDLESHPSCYNDFLAIFVGRCATSSPTRLCGWALPRPITSKGGQLCVMFRSDSMVSLRGFNASVEVVVDVGGERRETKTPAHTAYVTSSTHAYSPSVTSATPTHFAIMTSSTPSGMSATTTVHPISGSVDVDADAWRLSVRRDLVESSLPTPQVQPYLSITSTWLHSELDSEFLTSSSMPKPEFYSSLEPFTSSYSEPELESEIHTSSSRPKPESDYSSEQFTSSYSEPELDSEFPSSLWIKPELNSELLSASHSHPELDLECVTYTSRWTDAKEGSHHIPVVSASSVLEVASSASDPPNQFSVGSPAASDSSSSTSTSLAMTPSPSSSSFHEEVSLLVYPSFMKSSFSSSSTSSSVSSTSVFMYSSVSPRSQSSSFLEEVSKLLSSAEELPPLHHQSFMMTASLSSSTSSSVLSSTSSSVSMVTQSDMGHVTSVDASSDLTSSQTSFSSVLDSTAGEGGDTSAIDSHSSDVVHHNHVTSSIMPTPHSASLPTATMTSETTTMTSETTMLTSEFTSQSTTTALLPTTASPTTQAEIPELEMCKTQTAHVQDKMYVTSPGYATGQYPVNMHCGLTVATPLHRTLRVDFKGVSLEDPSRCCWNPLTIYEKLRVSFVDVALEYHYRCSWDRLTVFDGDGDVTGPVRLAICCGTARPSDVITVTSRLRLEFVSDVIVPDRGFRLLISAVDNESPKTSPKPSADVAFSEPASSSAVYASDLQSSPSDSDLQSSSSVSASDLHSSSSDSDLQSSSSVSTSDLQSSPSDSDLHASSSVSASDLQSSPSDPDLQSSSSVSASDLQSSSSVSGLQPSSSVSASGLQSSSFVSGLQPSSSESASDPQSSSSVTDLQPSSLVSASYLQSFSVSDLQPSSSVSASGLQPSSSVSAGGLPSSSAVSANDLQFSSSVSDIQSSPSVSDLQSSSAVYAVDLRSSAAVSASDLQFSSSVSDLQSSSAVSASDFLSSSSVTDLQSSPSAPDLHSSSVVSASSLHTSSSVYASDLQSSSSVSAEDLQYSSAVSDLQLSSTVSASDPPSVSAVSASDLESSSTNPPNAIHSESKTTSSLLWVNALTSSSANLLETSSEQSMSVFSAWLESSPSSASLPRNIAPTSALERESSSTSPVLSVQKGGSLSSLTFTRGSSSSSSTLSQESRDSSSIMWIESSSSSSTSLPESSASFSGLWQERSSPSTGWHSSSHSSTDLSYRLTFPFTSSSPAPSSVLTPHKYMTTPSQDTVTSTNNVVTTLSNIDNKALTSPQEAVVTYPYKDVTSPQKVVTSPHKAVTALSHIGVTSPHKDVTTLPTTSLTPSPQNDVTTPQIVMNAPHTDATALPQKAVTPSTQKAETTPTNKAGTTTAQKAVTTPSQEAVTTYPIQAVTSPTQKAVTTPTQSVVTTPPLKPVTTVTQKPVTTPTHKSMTTLTRKPVTTSPLKDVTTPTLKTVTTFTQKAVKNTYVEACTGVPAIMSANTGEITSPGFLAGQRYPNNANCQWVIEVPAGMMARLTFTSFKVEAHPKCSFDKLAVWENEADTGTLLGKFCGSSLPPDVTSYQSLAVSFSSDRIGQEPGFRAQYELVQYITTTSAACPEGRVACQSGLCIPHQWLCDGERDCPHADDESNCQSCGEGEFRCGDASCVAPYHVCDGTPHCEDREDEEMCVRVSAEGLLQVNREGTWLPVCGHAWTPERAHGACAAAILGPLVKTETTSSTSDLFALWTNQDALMYQQARGTANLSVVCPSNSAVRLICAERECGRGNSGSLPQPYVLGSQGSVDGQWPWTVAIMTGQVFQCGGSLIADHWVLTAGHCIYNLINIPERLTVTAGHVTLNAETKQEARVTEIVLHPDNDYIYRADVALLRLQRPLATSNTVRRVCLPRRVHQWSPNTPCYVSGWGITDIADLYSNQVSSLMHHAKVKLWDQQRCQAVYPSRLRPSMICAGYEHGEMDACKGDSGGPLVCQSLDGAWSQVGVVSWGEGCGSKGKPGVYTRVDSYLQWIDNTTEQQDTSANCTFETPFVCGYVTEVNVASSFLWSRRRGGSTLPPRPVADHTLLDQTGHYMYAQISDVNRLQRTTLFTPTLHLSGVTCLTFHLVFSGGAPDATLTVAAIGRNNSSNQSRQLLHLRDGRGDWSKVEAELPDWTTQVSFTVKAGVRIDSGIGIDDVTVVRGRCADTAKLSCSFHGDTLCQYQQSTDDSADWQFWNTPTDGPFLQADLTAGGYGDTALLVSPVMTSSVTRCLHFRYRIFPAQTTTLSVCTLSLRQGQGFLDCSSWARSNSALDDGGWAEGRAALPAGAYPYALVFHARRGNAGRGGVACIDSVVKVDGPCP